MSNRGDDWSTRVAKVVAGEVRRYRQDRKMTVDELSTAMKEHGAEMAPAVIYKLEQKKRATVSVAEVLAMSAALRVPPALLLFPLGRADHVEVAPGVEVGPWEGLMTFTGEGVPGPDVSPDDPARVPSEWRHHVELVEEWWRRQERIVDAEAQAEGKVAGRPTVMLERRYAERTETGLRTVRAALRRQGVTPPVLPAELEHLDGGTGS